jgi:hypothetical protein
MIDGIINSRIMTKLTSMVNCSYIGAMANIDSDRMDLVNHYMHNEYQ